MVSPPIDHLPLFWKQKSKMVRNGSTKLLSRLRAFPPASRTPTFNPVHGIRAQRQFFMSSCPASVNRVCHRRHLFEPFLKSPIRLASYSLLRQFTTDPLPKRRSRLFRFTYRLFAYAGGFVLITGGLVVAFFLYDASTYREDLSYTDIPVSENALEPRKGGPKNLPIAEILVDDDDCPENSSQKYKPKLVILGSGWGSVAILKTLNPEDYHVTVVSPVNYFLFTPMLPSATVGTLELRSLVEPIRRIVSRVKGHFLKAEAVDVELSEKLLEVSQTNAQGEECHFYLPYDKLILGVGWWILASTPVRETDIDQAPPPTLMASRV